MASGLQTSVVFLKHQNKINMKTIFVTIAAALISLNAAAHNPGKDPDNYCVKSKNGKMVVMHNGAELTETIKLSDGTRVKPNGTIVFTNGKRVKLEKGECVDENNLDHFADRKGIIEEKVDEAERKAEKKADKAEEKIEKKTDKAEKKLDKEERKAEKKMDRAKERPKDEKEDVEDKMNDDLDQ